MVTVLIFALLATQVVSFAWTDIVTNTNFEGGGLPWHVVEDYPAKAEFEIANNEYVIEVIDPGEAQWGIQFRHRQILLNQECSTECLLQCRQVKAVKFTPK